MVTDVHGHYIPADSRGVYSHLFELKESDAGKTMYVNGRFLGGLQRGLADLEAQVSDMDAAGIDERLLAIPPFCFQYTAPEAGEWARWLNDTMASDIEPYRGRFRLLGTLPMLKPEDACRELERIMAQPAFCGVQLATNIAGRELDAPDFEPVWALLERLGAFVLLHPHYVISDARMQRFHLRNLAGNPLDTTLAAFYLMTGGVLERHPGLHICLSHAGGYLPYALSRFEHGQRVRREFADVKTPLRVFADRFYYDTVLHDPECLDFAVRRAAAGHVLLGTDYPFDMGVEDPVGLIRRLQIGESERKGILSGNIQKILQAAASK